jgi:two-component system nitrogen regulation sensor histidine kinase NtrY
LLGENADNVIGKHLSDSIPELKALIDEAESSDKDLVTGQIVLLRHGRERTLHVQVKAEQGSPDNHGSVVTLDDLTDLVAAQRNSAWADVARRIAHEIKNPLTPIQLSAERLKRRFGDKIGEGSDVFNQCTDTIIRQVGDIGKMVDEFSSFARTPKPNFELIDLNDIARETVFLAQVGHPKVRYSSILSDEKMLAKVDRRLLAQSLTNLLKNAAEAIEPTGREGKVSLRIYAEGDKIHLDIQDNGVGLPNENRNRLLEPYVTTRSKGTGLGLAIVGRIMEDHEGKLMLLDPLANEAGDVIGALIRLVIPKND